MRKFFLALPLVGAALAALMAPAQAGYRTPAVQPITCATHLWINTISANMVPSCTQPGVTDLAGLGNNVGTALGNTLNATGGLVGFGGSLGAASATSLIIGAGSAITSSGAGGALGSNAFTSTAYAPIASPTFTGTQTLTTALTTTLNGNTITTGTGTLTLGSVTLNAGAGGTLASGAFAAAAPCSAFGTAAGTCVQGGVITGVAVPDTVISFYTVTTTAGSGAITLTGANFVSGDVGKLITIYGAGPSITNNKMVATITGVTNATHITVAALLSGQSLPTQSLSAVSEQVYYGTDQYSNLQSAFNTNYPIGVTTHPPSGTYLISQPLTVLPPTTFNNFGATPPLAVFDEGTTIVAMATMQAVVTYGSNSVSYSGFIRDGFAIGGMFDANNLAQNCVYAPFYFNITFQNQGCKNMLLWGWNLGALTLSDTSAAPASAAAIFTNSYITRDHPGVAVTSIAAGLVTTAVPHGLTDPAVHNKWPMPVVFITGNSGVPEAWYAVGQVNSATTYTIFNGSALTGTGGSSTTTLPSMGIPLAISAMTNAATGVFTTGTTPHGFAVCNPVYIADLGGVYTAAVPSSAMGQYQIHTTPTSTTFTLEPYNPANCGTGTAVNTSTWGTYTGSPSAGSIEYLDPTKIETAIYANNSTDTLIQQFVGYGYRIGIGGNSVTALYDGHYTQVHLFNYPQDGNIFKGFDLTGDSQVVSGQVDGPFRYAYAFGGSGLRNQVSNSNVNYGDLAPYNLYASPIRLESGAQVRANNNNWKSASSYPLISDGSGDTANLTGANNNYINVQVPYLPLVNGKTTADSLFGAPFGIENFSSGVSTMGAVGSGTNAQVAAACTAANCYGAYIFAGAGGSGIATLNNSLQFLANPIYFLNGLGVGINGSIYSDGSSSGTMTITTQAAAGTPSLLWPTGSGTLVSSASLPLVENATTGALSCPTCATSSLNTAALTKVDDTNVTLTLGGSPSTALLNAASIAVGWTGQLAPNRGGTGINGVATAGTVFNSTGANTWNTSFTPILGVAGTATGKLLLAGTISGAVTISPQDAAGTFNFNLPTTAGVSGALLTSGGGGSSPMTWTVPGTDVATALGNAVNGIGGFATSAVTALSSLGSVGTLTSGSINWDGSIATTSNITASNAFSPALTAQTSAAAGQSTFSAFNSSTGQIGIQFGSGYSGGAASLTAWTGNGAGGSNYASNLMSFTANSVAVTQPLTLSSTINIGGNTGITKTCTIAVGNVLTFTLGILTATSGVAGCA